MTRELSAERRAALSAVILTVCFLVLSWNSILIYAHQSASLAAPGVPLGMTITMVIILLTHQLPVRPGSILAVDGESDWIVAMPFYLAGVWITYWLPGRFGEHFWIWRPDNLGVITITLGVAALIGGTRYLLWLLGPMSIVAFLSAPIFASLALGFSPKPTDVAAVSAVFAAAPWLLTRPFVGTKVWRRWAFLAAAMVCGTVAGVAVARILDASRTLSSMSAAGTAAIIAGVLMTMSRRTGRFIPMPNLGFVRTRWAPVAVAVVISCAVQFSLPTPQVSEAGSPLTPQGEVVSSLRSTLGMAAVEWMVHSNLGNDTAYVVQSQSRNEWTVATYPTTSYLNIPEPPCPNVTRFTSLGRHYVASVYQDAALGYRWTTLTWLQRSRSVYQRVTILLEILPPGVTAPAIIVTPNIGVDAGFILGNITSGRRLVCSVSPAELTVMTSIAASITTHTSHARVAHKVK